MLRALQCRSVLTLALVLAVVGGFSAQSQEASSQQTASVDQPTVFRSGITLVTTDVIVRDGDGVFLPDLTVDDFQVFEEIPHQKNDFCVSMIVTDKRIIHCDDY